jgi:hypothetical protein
VDPESNKKTPTQYRCCGGPTFIDGETAEEDPICSNPNSKCIYNYDGPLPKVKDNYNLTHPRTSKYDTYLNLFKCAAL